MDTETDMDPAPSRESRHAREIAFHAEYAARNQQIKEQPIPLELVRQDSNRRWWNANWNLYTLLRETVREDLSVLVVGCGFGEDPILLTHLSAKVVAFDISAESLAIASHRAPTHAQGPLRVVVAAAEAMPFDDGSFDVVVCIDILHHTDLKPTLAELRRVGKPNALLAINEIYTHRMLQRIRESWLVDGLLYRPLCRFVYGTSTPYVTEDEEKLREADVQMIKQELAVEHERYFNAVTGRLVHKRHAWIAKCEVLLLGRWSYVARVLGGRVCIAGRLTGTQATAERRPNHQPRREKATLSAAQ